MSTMTMTANCHAGSSGKHVWKPQEQMIQKEHLFVFSLDMAGCDNLATLAERKARKEEKMNRKWIKCL